MPYSFYLQFASESAAEEALHHVEREAGSLSPDYMDNRISFRIPDAAGALAILSGLRNRNGMEEIRLLDEDGWECEEIDLWRGEALAGYFRKLMDGIPVMSDVPATCGIRAAEAGPRLILASQSPRREELLALSGIPFTSSAADVDESALTEIITGRFNEEPFSIRAVCTVMGLAAAKARKVLSENPDAVVIGADTIVTIDESILGKPHTPENAMAMLRRLSGRDHHVFTGVSIVSAEREDTFFSCTRVGFHPWSPCEEELAARYISGGSPLDKAGAYGIQDMGALFIRGIKGDYYTVMGLPVAEVYRRLQDFGIAAL